LIALFLPACDVGKRQNQGDARKITAGERQPQVDARKITVAVVQSKSATIEHSYKCRIDSESHVQVHSPVEGRLAAILVKEGQAVKRGDLLFQVAPPRDKEKPGAEDRDKVVSIEAPCDGLLVGLRTLLGNPVRKGTHLAALSDNSAMWVQFEMPERHYLALITDRAEDWRSVDLELILADQGKYPHTGKINQILASFNNINGDISFLAEFPNPDGVLRRGQTGTLLIKREVKDAILLIPRRATFEGPNLWKRYVYVVDKDHVAHRREIVLEDGADDVSVVEKGVEVGDRIVVDGVGQVHDGDKVE
jgi:membrane fusion protein (multidrug efflux system)